ncbi:MAG: carbohydrate ABC transporter substrate-binding protein, partial [Chloroflexi bacterium]|nr:carbohydrate ABC transporter substrate-binding protein [Chloroflexota bacterium]
MPLSLLLLPHRLSPTPMPRLVSTLVLILILLTISACANSTLLPPPPALPTPVVILPTPQVLTYLTPFTAAPIQSWNDHVLTEFQNDVANVEIEHAAIPALQYQAQLPNWLQRNPAPDILTSNLTYELRALAAEGRMWELGEVWEEAGWDKTIPAVFRQAVSLEDQPYFLPYSWYWWGLWYRKSILAEVGITPPQDWEELLAACDTLRAADYIPITIGLQERWPAAAWFDYLNLRLNGADFHKRLMAGEEPYDSPEVRDVFNHWAQLLEHRCFIDDPEDLTWQEALTFMREKQAAMMLMGQFLIESVPIDQRPDYDFVAFPRLREDVPQAEEAPL